jgi:hypothetical protein
VELGHHLAADDGAWIYLYLYLIMDVWAVASPAGASRSGSRQMSPLRS